MISLHIYTYLNGNFYILDRLFDEKKYLNGFSFVLELLMNTPLTVNRIENCVCMQEYVKIHLSKQHHSQNTDFVVVTTATAEE